jgi:acetylglutamate kinase
VLVVKLGGHALDDLSPAAPVLVDLAQDVAELRDAGVDVVVVHGGGPQIAELLERSAWRAVPRRPARDRRRDDALRRRWRWRGQRAHHGRLNDAGLASVGLTGVDATLLRAEPLGEPWGRVGASPKVNRTEIVGALWAAGLTPVVSPVAVDEGRVPQLQRRHRRRRPRRRPRAPTCSCC